VHRIIAKIIRSKAGVVIIKLIFIPPTPRLNLADKNKGTRILLEKTLTVAI
jgi:hypothetical protein